ncbi:MAG TPA: aminoglycoside adenylyltransferase domain-containing protein [Pyrinomonadaceae bacterium]|nr:aminoglycoside adenylyltransferase domain-containing protein [Pyrinomonadaceae bacterium]
MSVLLARMACDFPSLLKDNLTGIYLWGSLTYDGFDERCSDVDVIVVTKKDINEREFSALDDWFAIQLTKNFWTSKLDMRFVIDGEFLDKTSRCVGYHFGKLTRHGSDANPIIWVNIKESGITLWGKPAREIAPFVSDKVLNDALILELEYLKEDLAANAGDESDLAFFHNSYAVLTACRIFYTAFNRKLVSKDTASNFALKNLPEKWRGIILTAKENRIKGKGSKTAQLEKDAMDFVYFIENRVKEML